MRFRVLCKDETGVAAIELSILLPMILFLIFYTYEIAYVQIVNIALNRAAAQATLYSMTGQPLKDKNGNLVLVSGNSVSGVTAVRYLVNTYLSNLHLVNGSHNTVTIPDPVVLPGWDSSAASAEPCAHNTGYNDTNDATCSKPGECYSDINNNGTREVTLTASDGAIILYSLHYETPYMLGSFLGALGFGDPSGKYIYNVAFAGRREGAPPTQRCPTPNP